MICDAVLSVVDDLGLYTRLTINYSGLPVELQIFAVQRVDVARLTKQQMDGALKQRNHVVNEILVRDKQLHPCSRPQGI